MFEKEAKKWVKENTRIVEHSASFGDIKVEPSAEKGFQKGAEFGYKKGFEECAKARLNVTTISDCPIKDEWHDLRKNPDDLPTENKRYLCLIETSVGGATIYECSDYDTEYNSWKDSYGDVIKWKEIE